MTFGLHEMSANQLPGHFRRRMFAFPLLMLPALAVLPSVTVAQAVGDSTSVRMVRPGIVHQFVLDRRGPWWINILKIDLTNTDVDIEGARAFDQLFGREHTSSMAARKSDSLWEVVAALNADFFDLGTGENENNQIIDGVFVKGTKITGSPFDTFDNVHSQFGFSYDRRPSMERYVFAGFLLWSNGSRSELHGVNDVPTRNSFVLFNSYYGRTSPADTMGLETRELELTRVGERFDTLLCIVTREWQRGGESLIPPNGYVASAFQVSSPLPEAQIGDTVRVWLGLHPVTGRLKTLVGGWPRLVLNGRNIAGGADSLEGTFPRFSASRHPRSGVGFTQDSSVVVFITVDGRSEHSTGMSLIEFGDLMIATALHQGLNLDGGGSTTLVIEGRVVNAPSDRTGERAVGNALLVRARRN